jgi:hypothetical protein
MTGTSEHTPDPAGSREKDFVPFLSFMFKKIFTPENVWAIVLFLIVAALVVFTTNDSPIWIYQGF